MRLGRAKGPVLGPHTVIGDERTWGAWKADGLEESQARVIWRSPLSKGLLRSFLSPLVRVLPTMHTHSRHEV